MTLLAEAANILDAEWRAVASSRVDEHRKRRSQYEETFRNDFLRDVSTLPEDVPETQLLSIDGDDERSVTRLNDVAFATGTDRINTTGTANDGSPRKTRYYLTETQRERLDDLLAAGDPVLTAEEIESVIRHGEPAETTPRPTRLTKEDEAFERFLQKTFDERCAARALEEQSEPDEERDEPDEESESGPTATPVVAELLGKVVADVDAPVGQLRARPGQGDVIGNIRDFALAPGPADVPAFFDFHQLNIAFDHVWKEFLDERVEPLARAAFLALTGLGGDPAERVRGGRDSLGSLSEEASLVASAGVGTSPRKLYLQRLGRTTRLGARGVFDDGLVPGPGEITPPPPPPPPLPDDDDDDGLTGVFDTGIVVDPGKVFETEPRTLVERLRRILRGPYSFTAFGADRKSSAINFGLTVTYRQRWEPVTYQVGELVRTITLAPGETKKFTKKTRVTRKRAEKEIEKNSSIRRDEFNTTTRGEAEIVRKAQSKTNFSISAEGTYNFGLAKGDSTTTTDHDAESASNDTKKSFREAVVKASQEYRQERTLEISSDTMFDTEEMEVGEINNPNNELTVTYLFFELQRRFRITEQIYAAQPVVLVAQDVPRPNQIDEAFAIRYGWILKRALLDDKYEPVLEYVAGPLAGDKVARDALYSAMENHRRVVETLKDDLYAMKEQASEGYEALRRAVEARIEVEAEEETDSLFSDIKESFVGGGQDPEAARMREEAARNHEQRAVEEVKRLTLALQREISAYTEATDKYTKAQRSFKEWELRIADLLLHLKENILHYMQSIWAYEHPDQRFLRLHMKTAPGFEPRNGGASYRFLGDLDLTRETVAPDGTVTTRTAVEFEFTPSLQVVPHARTLAEIADLDALLGFKGNYMIFPLRESNPLTDYMLEPYVDAGFRLLDPDDAGNVSREDFARYVCHLRETLDDEAFDEIRPTLLERFERLLLSNPGNGDEIIVPTGSAYIEALPGANPLLEDFKLAHRALDVLDAQENVREATIENLRRAARILDDDLEDPEIDARYVIEGAGTVNVGTPRLGGGDTDSDE